MSFSMYKSRVEAGHLLAKFVETNDSALSKQIKNAPNEYFCFTIPNGGVPVAEGLCTALNLNYDLLIVRKIKIPYNTEAGFGSVTTDGTVLLNQELLPHLNLTESEIKKSIEITKREIGERLKFYNKSSNLEEDLKKKTQGKSIFMLDDGLASGFSMLAAIKMIKKYAPKNIYIAVPTAPFSTVERIKNEVNRVFCPNVRKVMQFAVADAYLKWYDVPETEVLEILRASKYYLR